MIPCEWMWASPDSIWRRMDQRRSSSSSCPSSTSRSVRGLRQPEGTQQGGSGAASRMVKGPAGQHEPGMSWGCKQNKRTYCQLSSCSAKVVRAAASQVSFHMEQLPVPPTRQARDSPRPPGSPRQQCPGSDAIRMLAAAPAGYCNANSSPELHLNKEHLLHRAAGPPARWLRCASAGAAEPAMRWAAAVKCKVAVA